MIAQFLTVNLGIVSASNDRANLNYHMSIKTSQAILKCSTDLKSSSWFTLGSDDETMFCDTGIFRCCEIY